MIENRATLARSSAHEVALDCLAAGIEAADPARLTREAVSLSDDILTVGEQEIDLSAYSTISVLGGGNAAGVVAAELEAILGDRLTGGVVVTDSPRPTECVTICQGDHPVPSESGVESTRKLLAAAREADSETLVLGVITGGGSALMAAPADGISLADLQATTEALLDSGASIDEINAVRKHCSAIKGGRLAAATHPARTHCLVISDVVGNDLSTIASGPFVPDPTTYGDALAVVDRYGCAVPDSVTTRLKQGAESEHTAATPPETPTAATTPPTETPTAGDPYVGSVTTTIIGDGMVAMEAAAAHAVLVGFEPLLLSARIRGEAREAAFSHVAIAEEITATGNPVEPPAVVISGGETTVTIRGDGTGGPNQEFVLSAACELADGDLAGSDLADGDLAGSDLADSESAPNSELAGEDDDPSIVVAAVDTDGIDGVTEAAGGIVDTDTVEPVAGRDALADNNAFSVLDSADALIRTGATGTNVNDLRVVVVA